MKKPSWFPEPERDPNNPSKSQLKREFHELKDFGLELLKLPQAQLDQMEMDEELREALADLRKMNNLPARRRQAQYVRKLLVDVNLEPFRRALAARRGK